METRDDSHKYLSFRRRESPSKKTVVVDVVSKSCEALLGRIKWFGRWRQYAFFPASDTVFNSDCLSRINEEIEMLMYWRVVAREKVAK